VPTIVATAQSGLSIERGPVFRVDLLDLADQSDTVISMVAHHLCIDLVSWRIIVQDLGHILETGSLPPDTPLSFRSWGAQQSAHDKTVDAKALLPYKESQPDLSYWGTQRPLTYGGTDSRVFTLDEKTTKLALVDCHETFRSEPVDLFLAAISHAFVKTFPDRGAPALHIENHGREAPEGSDADLSRTVGWFTTICPLVIPLRAGENDVLDAIRRSKDIRRSIPGHGRPYFAHQYLAEKSGATWSPMEVLFNYLGGGVGVQQQGDPDSLVRAVDLNGVGGLDSPSTSDVGPETRRLALFEISAVVVNNKLQFRFLYDNSLSRAGDVCRWIGACKNTLEDMTRNLMQRPAEPTLSDYPLLPLTYDTLHTLTNISLPRAGIDRSSFFSQVEDIYPCTPVQDGMLIGQLRNPNAYMFHGIYKVKHIDPHHQLDANKISRAWQMVVDRHAALRTVFIESMRRDGVFDQVVLKKVDSGAILLSSSDKEAMAKLGQVDIRTAQQQPQFPHQFAVCTTHGGRVFVKLEVNHAAMDGGSLAIILNELASAYMGTLEVAPGPLYSDYVQYIRALPVNEGSGYWARYLKGLRPCYFPSLNASNTTLTSETRSQRSFVLQFDRYAELRRLSEEMHVTLANMMHTAWAFVLRKYTESDDVCFGYLTAGRDAPVENIGRTVGTLINMLCCRVQISTSQTLENIFQTAQDQHLESVPFQHCSLARVQHELGLAGKPLYNTSISTQNNSKGGETGVEDTISFELEEGQDPNEVSGANLLTLACFLFCFD
jgi:non-ribosomal peptide synthase protein (TIGR01720 family)